RARAGMEASGFPLRGVPPEEAAALGELFGQNSVLTRQGLTDLTRGTTIPSRGRGETSPHGWFELPNGERISLDLDWDAPLPAPQKRLPWAPAAARSMPYEPYRFDHYSQQEGLTSLDPNM